jgi:hypothetical protein
MGKLSIPFMAAVGCAAVLALGGAMLHNHRSGKTPPLDAWIGKPLPDFHLQNTSVNASAEAVFSNADLSREKTVIAVVKADCQECRKEGTSLRRLQEDFRNKLRIVIVSVSGPGETAAFQRATGLDQNVYFGGIQLASSMEINSVPFLLFVGEDGHIQFFIEGSRSYAEVHTALDQFASNERITTRSMPQKSPFQINFLF